MASELTVELKLVGSVNLALGEVFRAIEGRISQLEARGKQIGRVLKVTTQEAVRLGTEFKNANDRASQSAREWLSALESISKNLGSQLADVPRLTECYQKLGKAMQSAQLPAGALQATDHGAKLIQASESVLGAAGRATLDSASYGKIITDIKIKAGLTSTPTSTEKGKPLTAQEQTAARIPNVVDETRKQSGMGKAEAADLIRKMLDAGIAVDMALDLAPLAAQYVVGQNVDAIDTAEMFRALETSGVSKEDMPTVLNALLAQARAGGDVSIADVTQMLPKVTAALINDGKSGPGAAILAGQMIQERGHSLGTNTQIVSDVQNRIERGQLPPMPVMEKQGQEQEQEPAFDYLKAGVDERRNDSAQLQTQMGAAFEGLSISVGDVFKPFTDFAVRSVTKVTEVVTGWVDANKKAAAVVSVLGLGTAALFAGMGVVGKGKALVDAGRSVFSGKGEDGKQRGGFLSRLIGGGGKGGKSDGVVLVHVVNMPRAFPSRGGAPDKYGFPPKQTLSSGSQDPNGVSYRSQNYRATPSNGEHPPLSLAGQQAPGDALVRSGSTQTGALSTSTGSSGGGSGSSNAASRLDVASAGGPGAGPASTNAGAGAGAGAARGGGFFKTLGKVAGKFVPGAALVGAGMGFMDVFQNATTLEEQVSGYSTVAGGLGGALAGGAAGAALGSVVPVVGTLIGGLVGSAVGAMGGEGLGGWLGGSLLGGRGKSAKSKSKTKAKSAQRVEPEIGEDGRPKAARKSTDAVPVSGSEAKPMTQGAQSQQPQSHFTLSPTIPVPITIHTNVADVDRLVRELQPALQRLFADMVDKANRRGVLYDGASVN